MPRETEVGDMEASRVRLPGENASSPRSHRGRGTRATSASPMDVSAVAPRSAMKTRAASIPHTPAARLLPAARPRLSPSGGFLGRTCLQTPRPCLTRLLVHATPCPQGVKRGTPSSRGFSARKSACAWSGRFPGVRAAVPRPSSVSVRRGSRDGAGPGTVYGQPLGVREGSV